jgi:agmatine deiminase
MNIEWETLEPDRSGYRMPAEWERHDRIWMGWPQRPDVWREKAGPGMQAFVQVVLTAAHYSE